MKSIETEETDSGDKMNGDDVVLLSVFILILLYIYGHIIIIPMFLVSLCFSVN